MPPLTLRPTLRLFLATAIAVPVVCFAHEGGHHAIASLECGGIGRLVFLRFQERDGCQAIAGNIAGPVFSFLLLWIGVLLTGQRGRRVVGFALVIGSLPIMRLLSVTSGGDDWNYAARLLRGDSMITPLTALVSALVLPALVLTWRRVRLPRQWIAFPLALTLPAVPSLLPFVLLDAKVYEEYIFHPEQFTQPALLGVPLVVLAVYGLAHIGYFAWAHGVLRAADPVTVERDSAELG